jgi:hypothetical protein
MTSTGLEANPRSEQGLTTEEQVVELFSLNSPTNRQNNFLIVAAMFADAPNVVAIYELRSFMRSLVIFSPNSDALDEYWEQRSFLTKEVYAFHFLQTSDFVDSANKGVQLRATRNKEVYDHNTRYIQGRLSVLLKASLANET